MVQTMKKALRKCLLEGGGEQWNELLPYVAMGYRLCKQKSLGYSPYFMRFGREPIFQARIQDEEERDFDETQGVEAMKVFLDRRGQIFQEVRPLAFKNLAIS